MELINNILGLNIEKLEPYQMASRAVVIFFISLLFIRISGIRTLGKQTAFDTLTSLMMGAILGRAIVTNQSFFGSILATLVLMLLHRFIAWVTFRNKKVGVILKGKKILLMKNGRFYHKNLAKTHITEEDILECLRKDINIESMSSIKEINLERSGDLSYVKE
jgi:uncharacterized membrane protein YcaP (DUF421 family)